MCVSDVLIREQVVRSQLSPTPGGPGDLAPVNAELDAIVTAMKCLGGVFPLASYQVNKVEQGRLDSVSF